MTPPKRSKPSDGRRTTKGTLERRWQALLDTVRDAVISIDSHGRIILFNREAERIFGITADEALGEDVEILMPAPYQDQHGEYIRRYEETGVAKAIGRIRHVEGRRKNGEIFPIELSVSKATIEDQVAYTAIIRDVSDRRRAEGELRDLQKLAEQRERLADIGAITAQIVHDLGNPLAAISMQAQLIVRRARRDATQPVETVLKPAELIVARVNAMDALVREFLDFTREQHIRLTDVPIRSFLDYQANLWRPLTQSQHTKLVVDAPEDLAVSCDSEKLARVVENLVKNALEAIGQGAGRVVLRASVPTPEKIRISVEDDGPGISESIDVFKLFETTKPHGTGLGLAIARQIVQAHGGNISHEKIEPHGTVFHIDLPRPRNDEFMP